MRIPVAPGPAHFGKGLGFTEIGDQCNHQLFYRLISAEKLSLRSDGHAASPEDTVSARKSPSGAEFCGVRTEGQNGKHEIGEPRVRLSRSGICLFFSHSRTSHCYPSDGWRKTTGRATTTEDWLWREATDEDWRFSRNLLTKRPPGFDRISLITGFCTQCGILFRTGNRRYLPETVEAGYDSSRKFISRKFKAWSSCFRIWKMPGVRGNTTRGDLHGRYPGISHARSPTTKVIPNHPHSLRGPIRLWRKPCLFFFFEREERSQVLTFTTPDSNCWSYEPRLNTHSRLIFLARLGGGIAPYWDSFPTIG